MRRLTLKSRTIAILLAAAGFFAATSAAQAQNAADRIYVIDARSEVVKSGSDLCWRTGYWTPAAAANDPAGCSCDKDLLPKSKCDPVAPTAAAPSGASNAAAQATAAAAPAKSVTLGAKELFGFNAATLSKGGAAEIDKAVIAKLPEVGKVTFVMVTGHTDRLGSHEYNQKLSEKRANAVKAYLVKKGMKAEMIETMGAGKTQPVPGVSCKDDLPRSKLVECLAPNRRVVVEIKADPK
jgi:OOP family OmpA-OmpF porin